MKHVCRIAALLLATALTPNGAPYGHAQASAPDLSALSLEDLTHVEVSSVSRKDQELFRTPAAVYVITREDIRNSGINSIPELFRIVPGMQVAQAYANEWAISSRGFNSIFADKMLVLVDGRSIYSEIYSGVFWEQNDLLLEDIEHIEVIRGSGGAVWGANAVNGVINIITSKAKALNGSELIAEGGNRERMLAVRTGAELRRGLQYRAYFKDVRRMALQNDQGGSANDAANLQSGGLRLDWQMRAADWLTLHSNLLDMRADKTVVDFDGSGTENSKKSASSGYVLSRWEHRTTSGDFALQAYFSQEIHHEMMGEGRERSLDLDFQNHVTRIARNDVTWGLGYRLTTDRMGGSDLPFMHNNHRDTLFSSFFEDDVALLPETLTLTGGVKLQHNSFSAFEVQPTLRLLWLPRPGQSIWASTSRAVRTPSVQDMDLSLDYTVGQQYGLPLIEEVRGNPAFQSEVLRAWELGYRQQFANRLSLDLASFFNVYSGLRNRKVGTTTMVTSPQPAIVIPVLYDNGIDAHSRGLEASITWNPARTLRAQASYSWENAHLRLMDGSLQNLGDTWNSPTHTVNTRANWNFARGWNWFTSFSFVSQLQTPPNANSMQIGAYKRLDSHIAYSISHAIQLRGGGDNLLEGTHGEFVSNDGYSVCGRISRSAYLKLVWSF